MKVICFLFSIFSFAFSQLMIGFVRIEPDVEIETVKVYTQNTEDTIYAEIFRLGNGFARYQFFADALGETIGIFSHFQETLSFRIKNFRKREANLIFDIYPNSVTFVVSDILPYEPFSPIAYMKAYLKRNNRFIIDSCQLTPQQGNFWNYYALNLKPLEVQPYDTLLIKVWRREGDFLKFQTLTTVWDTNYFGPYIWTISEKIKDTIHLIDTFTPYYFVVERIIPETIFAEIPFDLKVIIRNDSFFSRDYLLTIKIGESRFRESGHLKSAIYSPTYDTVIFENIILPTGTHPIICSLITNEHNPIIVYYDTIFTYSLPEPGWKKRKDLIAEKSVKDGSDMVYLSPRFIYAITGSNTNNFILYDILSDNWQKLETIPGGEKKKKVKKGCALATDNSNYIYLIKGGNTLEFWRYDISQRKWERKKDVPYGFKHPSQKETKLKTGCDMVYVKKGDSSFIYLLYGSKTNNLYSYYIERDTWIKRNNIPINPSGKPMDEGSCLTYDGRSNIYILKGKYGDFYKYNIFTDSFIQLSSLPEKTPKSDKKKKPKNGTAIAYKDNKVYCIKGGTPQFWRYDSQKDSWQLIDSLPINKTKGSSMIYVPEFQTFFFIIGNKTNLFFSYRERPIGIKEEENKFNLIFNKSKKTIYFKKELVNLKKDYSIFNSLGKKLNKEKITPGVYFVFSKNRKDARKILILK
ncbi:MAG: hypothetical protein N2323_03600 [candidate division WOR-3 bacterium]|nr:hypothetical protein [candidate division WOR-3 bacterium]MCX7837026.1 hypothetical protein [candidate division WOR-3 bacterium]MDW8114577.1 hypothetical protein [candidate division WOR-3 bacterium]